MSMDDQEMWDDFVSDGEEALRLIEESLLELETHPDDHEHVNGLYRALHTLKGNSTVLGLRSLERTAHACESLVGLVRDEGVPIDTEMVNVILEALDLVRASLVTVKRERRDVSPESVADLVARVEILRAARGGSAPSQRRIPDPASEKNLFDEAETPREAPVPAASNADTKVAVANESTKAAANDDTKVSPAPPKTRVGRADEERTSEYLRVAASKVSQLMDLANELGLACSDVTRHEGIVKQNVPGFAAAAHKLELLVREIQNDLSSLRLVAVAPIFAQMRRVVRDATQRTGKDVDFVVVGEETEVDKVMLDALHDPLVHVVRNAVDHGIESPSKRAGQNKKARGTITLSAVQHGGEVVIDVRDDGQGLDRERILARAIERGLCAPSATPSDDEIASFICAPGFTTKQSVDELSGRGVGMDVVKTMVEKLRGQLTVISTPGQGTCVRLRMPLTLAFVDALVVRERERLFAFPIEKVFEVTKIDATRVVGNAANGETMVRVHGECVPVMWLSRYWNEPPAEQNLDGRIVVVVQTSRGTMALPVDAIVGNQQVMLKPLRGLLSGIRAAAGCGMLRTGDVAVALDCERLVA